MAKRRSEIFAENLKRLRKSQGVKRQDLAEKIGVGVDTIARYERGEREPNFEKLFLLAAALDSTINDLLEETPSAEMLNFFLELANKAHLEPKQLPDGTITMEVPSLIVNNGNGTITLHGERTICVAGESLYFYRLMDTVLKETVYSNRTFNAALYDKVFPLAE